MPLSCTGDEELATSGVGKGGGLQTFQPVGSFALKMELILEDVSELNNL